MFTKKAPGGNTMIPAWFPKGAALLRDPSLNKGTAFTEAERDALGLRGLLPHHPNTQEEQVARVLENFRRKTSNLEKYINLTALHDRNETLFFRVIADHLDEMMPIIYTPDGRPRLPAVRAHLPARARPLRQRDRPRPGRERAAQLARARRQDDRRHRRRAHPRPRRPRRQRHGHPDRQARAVHGLRRHRPDAAACPSCSTSAPTTRACSTTRSTSACTSSGSPARAYDELVDEFVDAARQVFPGVIIQFEDFANHNAFRLLKKYRERDLHLQRRHPGHRGGRAGGPPLGAARHRRPARRPARPVPRRGRGGDRHRRPHRGGDARPRASTTPTRAARCWLVDSQGLVVKSRTGPRRAQAAATRTTTRRSPDFLGAMRALKPTAIIGVAAVGGTFTQEVVEEMTRLNERPIVFALSNPTSKSECTAEQAYQWSGGRALFASRQPVRPGRRSTAGRSCRARATTRTSSPASAWARSPSAPRRVTDEMFMAAARTLAGRVSQQDLAQGSLYPAARQGARRVGAHRRGGRRGRLRAGTRRGAPPGGPARLRHRADVRSDLPGVRVRLKRPPGDCPAAGVDRGQPRAGRQRLPFVLLEVDTDGTARRRASAGKLVALQGVRAVALHRINKGLDLPLAGDPAQAVEPARAVDRVALLGADYLGMRPTLLVKDGDRVLRGQPLFEDKKSPACCYTAPAAGTVAAINRGEMTRLPVAGHRRRAGRRPGRAGRVRELPRQAGRRARTRRVRALLVESGLWTALRTRPFSRFPPSTRRRTRSSSPPSTPARTRRRSRVVLAGREADFAAGVAALARARAQGLTSAARPGSAAARRRRRRRRGRGVRRPASGRHRRPAHPPARSGRHERQTRLARRLPGRRRDRPPARDRQARRRARGRARRARRARPRLLRTRLGASTRRARRRRDSRPGDAARDLGLGARRPHRRRATCTATSAATTSRSACCPRRASASSSAGSCPAATSSRSGASCSARWRSAPLALTTTDQRRVARDGADRRLRARDADRHPADVPAARAHHQRRRARRGAGRARARRGGPGALHVRLPRQVRVRPAAAPDARRTSRRSTRERPTGSRA